MLDLVCKILAKVSDTAEFARTWGRMKSNRSEEMNYEKMSRAMRFVRRRVQSTSLNLDRSKLNN